MDKKDVRVYPAYFSEEGAYVNVRFPDLPGCVTFGEGYADAIASARDALGGHLLCLEEDQDPLPVPTPLPQLRPEAGEVPLLVDVRLDLLREEESRRSVSKNVTIPKWLNDLAVEAHLNFSSILQEALRERLGV